MRKHPTLHTERLILRPLTVDDARPLFEAFGDPETMCERCLDSYADAVLQYATGDALVTEIDKLSRILAGRLQKEPELAEAVLNDLCAKQALHAHQRPIG